jgi:hypothetical protein
LTPRLSFTRGPAPLSAFASPFPFHIRSPIYADQVGGPRGRKHPNTTDVDIVCPMTSTTVTIDVVVTTWFGHSPDHIPLTSARIGSTPFNAIGTQVLRTSVSGALILSIGTSVSVVLADGTQVPVDSVAVFDLTVRVGADELAAPPEEWMDDVGRVCARSSESPCS